MREIEIWIFVSFAIITAWSLFGLTAFSHSYVMFMPLDESLQYDSPGNIFVGAVLFIGSCVYIAAATIRLALLICRLALRSFRADTTASPHP